jgi:hypothetical protein
LGGADMDLIMEGFGMCFEEYGSFFFACSKKPIKKTNMNVGLDVVC